MKILFESDRECTIDGVGLLKPGVPVTVNPLVFESYHGMKPTQANFPHFVKVTVDTAEDRPPVEPVEGGE